MLDSFLPSVPRYMTLPSVGLDISDTSVKYIEVDHRRANAKGLLQWGDVSVPAGVVQRGDVLEPQQLTAVLRECQEQTGAQFARVSLPEERAYLFETEIKRGLPLSDVRGLLEFRLAENVPLAAKDVYFDYTLLPGAPTDRSTTVAVTAYSRDTIDAYYGACVAAGLQPLAFEVEAQAMVRSTITPDTTGAVMLVDFGKTRTGIGIVYQNVLLYTSTIDVGGEELSAALRKVLGAGVSESELTRRKNTEGLVRGKDSCDVHDALISTISVIRDELSTRMQYWHMRTSGQPERRLGQLLLCGGSANLNGLPEYLHESLGVPARRADVWGALYDLSDQVPPIDQRHSLGYATAIGLALGPVLV